MLSRFSVCAFFVVQVLLNQSVAQQKRPAAKKAAPAKPAEQPVPQKAPDRWPIEAVSVDGNNIYTDQQILAVAGLKKGQLANKKDFEEARARLEATGAFATVGYRFAPDSSGSGYTATFTVVEAKPVYTVRFEELKVPAAELSAYLKQHDPLFGVHIPATKATLDRYIALLEPKVGEKVAAKILPEGNEVVVSFRPARAIPAVADVKFKGNAVIPSAVLQQKIQGVAIGVPYTEERFRQLLQTSIRPLYETRGRVRVTFPTITTEPAKDVTGLSVTVQVDESTPYNIGEVKLDNHSLVTSAELLKVAKFKTGDLANMDEVKDALDRIRKRLRREGYVQAEVLPQRKYDDEKKLLNLDVRIKEGPQYRMGRLTIEGLDINNEAGVRRIWSMKPGNPFNADYPEYFLGQVKEQKMFDDLHETKFTTKVDDENRVVDVTLFFK